MYKRQVDQWGVVSNEETDEKIGFGGYDSLFPQIAIVDPQLMKSVPAEFTAYQGFDALFHSVECYISAAANLMSDMYALTAVSYTHLDIGLQYSSFRCIFPCC